MKGSRPMLRLAAPLRVLAQRFTFLLLVAAAVGLMVLGKAEAPLVERARMAVLDGVVPVLDAIARPLAAADRLARQAQQAMDVHAENARLREENDRLQHWQAVARKLDAENASLRAMMNVAADVPVSFVSARVVAEAGGSFVRSVVVVAGERDGVTRGQTAITGDGLVGRVVQVGERSARVLLLVDLNSSVPVLVESSRERAIVVGDNSDLLRLQFLGTHAAPRIGDRIITSGHGGVFPAGLPVGVVVDATDGHVRIKPFANPNRLEALRLIDYALGGTLPQGAPAAPARRGGR
jgi:rod shape-determining protein MreC